MVSFRVLVAVCTVTAFALNLVLASPIDAATSSSQPLGPRSVFSVLFPNVSTNSTVYSRYHVFQSASNIASAFNRTTLDDPLQLRQLYGQILEAKKELNLTLGQNLTETGTLYRPLQKMLIHYQTKTFNRLLQIRLDQVHAGVVLNGSIFDFLTSFPLESEPTETPSYHVLYWTLVILILPTTILSLAIYWKVKKNMKRKVRKQREEIELMETARANEARKRAASMELVPMCIEEGFHATPADYAVEEEFLN